MPSTSEETPSGGTLLRRYMQTRALAIGREETGLEHDSASIGASLFANKINAYWRGQEGPPSIVSVRTVDNHATEGSKIKTREDGWWLVVAAFLLDLTQAEADELFAAKGCQKIALLRLEHAQDPIKLALLDRWLVDEPEGKNTGRDGNTAGSHAKIVGIGIGFVIVVAVLYVAANMLARDGDDNPDREAAPISSTSPPPEGPDVDTSSTLDQSSADRGIPIGAETPVLRSCRFLLSDLSWDEEVKNASLGSGDQVDVQAEGECEAFRIYTAIDRSQMDEVTQGQTDWGQVLFSTCHAPATDDAFGVEIIADTRSGDDIRFGAGPLITGEVPFPPDGKRLVLSGERFESVTIVEHEGAHPHAATLGWIASCGVPGINFSVNVN